VAGNTSLELIIVAYGFLEIRWAVLLSKTIFDIPNLDNKEFIAIFRKNRKIISGKSYFRKEILCF